MELTADVLGAGVIGLLVIAGAIGNYLSKRNATPAALSPMLSGVMAGFVDREQMERLIAAVNRIAEAIGDKHSAKIDSRLEDLVEKIDRMNR